MEFQIEEGRIFNVNEQQELMAEATYVQLGGGVVDIDQQTVAKYPREYAALAYLLEKSGFPVQRVFATRGSELEQQMKADAKRWLAA